MASHCGIVELELSTLCIITNEQIISVSYQTGHYSVIYSNPFLLVYERYAKVFHIVIFEFVTVINISVTDSCVGGFGIKTK